MCAYPYRQDEDEPRAQTRSRAKRGNRRVRPLVGKTRAKQPADGHTHAAVRLFNRLAGFIQGVVGPQRPRDRLRELRERAKLAPVGSAFRAKRGDEEMEVGCGGVGWGGVGLREM